MKKRLEEFREFREKLNNRILEEGTMNTKRFFALDSACYGEGKLPAKSKELMGLVASMVLRCEDCISYHLIRLKEHGTTREEFYEAFDVALIAGGSIVIPHMRKAVDLLEELENERTGE
jgi:AhpD family alkylhydroperoxidase